MTHDDYQVAKSLDLKGLLCPIPVVKVSKAINEINLGEVLEATATDPGVMMDIPAWCKGTGNELIGIKKEENVFRVIVRRIK